MVVIGCRRCSAKTVFRAGALVGDFSKILAVSPGRDICTYFRLVNLTDCASVYSSVLSLNPKTVGELTKINLSYIRDAVSNGVLSFVDACANLADLGTRNTGNSKIFTSFCRTGRFSISFVGRQGAKLLRNSKNSLERSRTD